MPNHYPERYPHTESSGKYMAHFFVDAAQVKKKSELKSPLHIHNTHHCVEMDAIISCQKQKRRRKKTFECMWLPNSLAS